MPATFEIDTALNLVILRYSGALELSDLFTVFANIRAHPDYRGDRMELCDMSAVTAVNFDLSEMRGLADHFKASYAARPGPVRVAHYAPGDLAFGMDRMFATLLSDAPNAEFGLFRTVPEVLAHLGLDRPGMARMLGLEALSGTDGQGGE